MVEALILPFCSSCCKEYQEGSSFVQLVETCPGDSSTTGLVEKKRRNRTYPDKNLELIKGLKDRSLGVGDIRIVSMDEIDPKIVLNDVVNPAQVKGLIWKAVREKHEKHIRQ